MAIGNRYNGGGPLAGVLIEGTVDPATGAVTAPTGSTSASPTFVVGGALPAGTDRSGTATTTSGGLTVAANAARRGLVGQNIGVNNIGFNEFGGTAAIGTAGTYTVAPGVGFSIATNRAVTFVAAGGNTAVTMTEY